MFSHNNNFFKRAQKTGSAISLPSKVPAPRGWGRHYPDYSRAAPSACRFLRSWMRLLIYILQLVFDHMGIDLGGRNIRMTQHFLNGPEVCTVFQQMHRK